MMRNRRRMLLTQLGSSFAIPSYTGSHAIFGDEKQGYIECYGSGDITFPMAGKVDICIVGGGATGKRSTGVGNNGVWTYTSGKGGDGGKIITHYDVAVIPNHDYGIQVGAAAGNSVFDGYNSSNGSVVASGGASVVVTGETAPSPGYWVGNKGEDAPHIFNDNRFLQYGGGGGSGAVSWQQIKTVSGGAGGVTGGGKGAGRYNKTPYYTAATAGTPNTGGGGGGDTISDNGPNGQEQSGGSGIVIIRWGYAA